MYWAGMGIHTVLPGPSFVTFTNGLTFCGQVVLDDVVAAICVTFTERCFHFVSLNQDHY